MRCRRRCGVCSLLYMRRIYMHMGYAHAHTHEMHAGFYCFIALLILSYHAVAFFVSVHCRGGTMFKLQNYAMQWLISALMHMNMRTGIHGYPRACLILWEEDAVRAILSSVPLAFRFPGQTTVSSLHDASLHLLSRLRTYHCFPRSTCHQHAS